MRNPSLGCAGAMGVRTIMNAPLRLCLVAVLCAGLTGCELLPGLGGVVGGLLYDGFRASGRRPPPRIDSDRCWASTDKGIAVTAQMGTAAPTDEGAITTFAPVDWRYASQSESYPDAWWLRAPIEGTLIITERSVLLLPPPGAAGVRIPFDLVVDVDVQVNSAITDPSSVIVKSCFARVDIFTLWQGEPKLPDPEAATAAAAKIRDSVAGFRAAADSAAQVQN